MPLQVWLPLTGDLTNNGFTDVPVISGTPVWLDNGKFGKCISLASRVMFKSTKLQSITNNNFSVAFWSRTDSSTTLSVNWVDLLGFYDLNTEKSGTGQFRFEACYASSLRACSWHNNANYNFTEGSVEVVPESQKGEWHHVCVTIGDARTKTYKDGVLIADTATGVTGGYLEGTFWIGETNNIVGGLNDLRVYDHVLSPKEVKVISQGLVAHYQLNGDGRGLPNLYTGTRNFAGTWVNSSNWTTDASQTFNGFTVKQRTGTWGGLAQNVTATKGDIFTISFYAKVEAGGTVESVHRSNLGNVTDGLSLLAGNFVTNNRWINTDGSITSWKYCWATLEIVGTDITYLQWRIENSQSNKTAWITRFKLEKGNKATAWMPNSADPQYSLMGYNDTTIYDSSGYNYHGATVGTLSISSNTPRYSVSTKFDNPNYIQYKAPANMYYATYSFWVNFDSFVAYGAIHIPKGNPTGGDTIWFSANTESSSLWAYFGGNSPHYTKAGTGNLVTNTWYHFAFTWNNGVSQWYLNGEPLGASVTYTEKTYIPNTNYATIGNSYTGTSWSGTPFNGRISDFRLYATALSADDIKTLYNAPVSVANNGAMITQGEFVEV